MQALIITPRATIRVYRPHFATVCLSRSASKRCAAFFKRPLHVLQTFEQEGVVSEVCLRIAVREPEYDEETLAQLVRPLHGVLQSVIVLRPLRLLHPVQDVVALYNLLFVQPPYACFLYFLNRHDAPSFERSFIHF